MLKNIVIGGVIGYFFAVLITIFGALWLLAPTLERATLFYGVGAIVLALILKSRQNMMPFAFVGFGIHFVMFLYQNGLVG